MHRTAAEDNAAEDAEVAVAPAVLLATPEPSIDVAPPASPASPAGSRRTLLASLLALSAPILAEHALHIVVGLTDTYLANHLVTTAGLTGAAAEAARVTNAASAAAVGSVTYLLWLVGLLTGAVGTGSTALIARSTGGGDRGTAGRALGQSVLLAVVAGVAVAGTVYLLRRPMSGLFDLQTDQARQFLVSYLKLLSLGVPFAAVMFIANSCLRGAGDTLSPAVAMIVVDVVNVVLSFGLCYGLWGMPEMGFDGIAVGTLVAYVAGGLLQLGVLAWGRGGVRLRWAAMRPDVEIVRRVLRVGVPSGAEGAIYWGVNFGVLRLVNEMGNVSAAAHVNTIRLESFSYMTGFAVATAAATMVGQSLGAGDAARARRSGLLAFAVGGGFMGLLGLCFIAFSGPIAGIIGGGPAIDALSARCLFTTGFCQLGFAASLVFGGVLRGAGDTLPVMAVNLASAVGLRLVGAYVVVKGFDGGLGAVWVVLASELMVRGMLMLGLFLRGRWVHVRV